MKSTIRSLAAIALSVAAATAFAANPTPGQRSFDLLDSWFTPQAADHPDQKKAEAAKKEARMAAENARKDNYKQAIAQKRAEPNTGMQ